MLPTYNEASNLEAMVQALLALPYNVELVVVDDASPDGTGQIADRLAAEGHPIRVIHRPGKMGLGSAYRDGFKEALHTQPNAIVQMDADFSHDPKYVEVLVQELLHCDLAIGSRYLHGVSVVNWPIRRLILSYAANVYARTITGVPLSDLSGGFKSFRREALERLHLDRISSQGYAFQIEMNVLAWDAGLRIREVPIIFVERRADSSKMSRKIALEAAWKVWLFRWNRKRGHRVASERASWRS